MAKYEKILIWYFSGTGNARFAANKISELSKQKGTEVSVYNIANPKQDFSSIDKNCLIGFCYPTHGFNAPPNVLKFIAKFPKGNSDVFLLNTRAGMKLYKLHLPGIGGMALWLPALFLFFKGYRSIGFRPLDLPSNWVSLHPGLKQKVVNSIYDHCNRTLSKFTNRIAKGKPVLNGMFWIPVDIALIPFTIGYYLFARFAIAKTFFANFNCSKCGLCIKQCPVGAIITKDDRPYWTFSCESCMQCMNKCPQRAIETAHGFTFLLWWLVFSSIPYLLMRFLLQQQLLPEHIYHDYFKLIYNILVFLTGLPLIFFGYRILHRLLKYRIINKIITFTSFTHYKFWRRYRNTVNQR